MGITGFYSWITTNYPNCFVNLKKPILFNHIYIDLNYLLHMCIYNSPHIKVTLKKIETMILDICANYHAVDTINICCDGSAPLAKLFLQRIRRLQEARTMIFNKDTDLNNSSLNFTPGSVFMESIDTYYNDLKQKLESTLNVKVNINNLEHGEAEIKIKNLINKHLDQNPISSHLLVTNDADVLLIISATKLYKSMYVLLKNNIVLSLDKLIETHIEKYGKGINPNYDFSFLNMFNGNDYLPKLRFSTIDKLWESYQVKLRKHKGLVLGKDVETGLFKINSDFLIDILKSLCGKISPTILKKTRLYEYKYDIYDNYVNGLIWCFHMYFNGKCEYNNYMYFSDVSPDPMLLMLHFMNYNINNSFNLVQSKPICNKLCSILLLPQVAKKLINEQYYSFMDKHSYLYEEERCKDCQTFYETMSELNKKYKESEHKDTAIRKQIANNQKAYETHKDKHQNLTCEMIEKIRDEYNISFLN